MKKNIDFNVMINDLEKKSGKFGHINYTFYFGEETDKCNNFSASISNRFDFFTSMAELTDDTYNINLDEDKLIEYYEDILNQLISNDKMIKLRTEKYPTLNLFKLNIYSDRRNIMVLSKNSDNIKNMLEEIKRVMLNSNNKVKIKEKKSKDLKID